MTEQAANRIKKSFSISRESEQYIRRVRAMRKIASDSEALDQILREAMMEQSHVSINHAYKTFYDTASDGDLAEDSDWAAFAQGEAAKLAGEVSSR